MSESNWIVSEFAAVNFHDTRLNDRFVKTAISLVAKPSAPIAVAAGSNAIAKGAYRMFANPKVCEDEISGSHITQSIERAKEHPVVYAIQDTTTLNYSANPSKLGSIGYNGISETNGMFLHSTLMVNQAGYPLGFLHQEVFARKSRVRLSRVKQRKINRNKRAKQKESKRWIDSLEQTAAVEALRGKVITLADRESDIYEFVAVANQLDSRFIIRASHNRNTIDDEKLFDVLGNAPILGTHYVEVDSVSHELEVKYIETEILPPTDRTLKTRMVGVNYVPQKVYVIEAVEKSSSKDKLHWILLTNLPTTNLEQAIERLNAYVIRWCIEVFHRILKTGCAIEKTTLESEHALRVMIALKSVIAVRLFQLKMAARKSPKAICTTVLSQDEWQALFARQFFGKQIPKEIPTLDQALLWLAQLGGYKRNPVKEPPGMTVIWRGWQELQSCMPLWASLKERLASNEVFCG